MDYKTILESVSDTKKKLNPSPFESLFSISAMPSRYRAIVHAAMELMTRSKDPFHKETHPARMAHDLLTFYTKDPTILSVEDLRALIVAIPLHDLSRALQPPTLYGAVYGLVTEKQNAANVARECMEKNGMSESKDGEFFQKVITAIDEHTLANTFDRKSHVSQWLYGLDCLDLFSRGRLHELDEYAKFLAEYWFFRPVMMWYKNWFIGVAKEFKFYQSVIEKEAKKRKPAAMKHLQKLKEKLGIPGRLKF